MIYSHYIDYAKSNNFQPISESAFNALIKAGFIFTDNGLTFKGV